MPLGSLLFPKYQSVVYSSVSRLEVVGALCTMTLIEQEVGVERAKPTNLSIALFINVP